jgi:amidase
MADLRIGLEAMAARDMRDPWYMPVPLEGPPAPHRVALCLRPDGMATQPEIAAALTDAGRRLEADGWVVEEVENLPSMREATEMQVKLWLGDNFAAQLAAAEREGDPGALAILRYMRPMAEALPQDVVASTLVQRNALTRKWMLFLEDYPVVLLPVSSELPFPDGLDLQGDAAVQRVLDAQIIQTGLPLMGLPGLVVSTGMVGSVPVGVQVIARRYREDLCLLAGEAIEAGGTPASPIDP